jgi:NAD(P)-dependent dehydrogenase (short-subunit alcohol dehydrogenase family)
MRTVLITGASSGIGAATVKALAVRGWNVCATMRNLDNRAALEQSLAQTGAAERVHISRLDIADAQSIGDGLTAILASCGNRLDAVVHNAAVAVGGAFEDLPRDDVRAVMETNFFGVLELTRRCLPLFRAQRQGRIVVVTSFMAFAGQPANSIYTASKWALEGWAESLAYEVEPFGIHVIMVEPGPYRTKIWKGSPRVNPPTSPYHAWTQSVFDGVDNQVAATFREPEGLAKVVARALEAPRPRLRYPADPIARLYHFLHGKIPSRLQQRATSLYLRLPRARV